MIEIDRDSWSEKSETNLMLKLTATRKWIPQKSKVLYLVTFLKPKSGDFGSLARPLDSETVVPSGSQAVGVAQLWTLLESLIASYCYINRHAAASMDTSD